MRKTLILMIVLTSSFTVSAAIINIDKGLYSPNFKVGDDWKQETDKIGGDINGIKGESQVLFMRSDKAGSDNFVQWKFTRTDASNEGVIEVVATEVVSGDGSWILFSTGQNEEQLKKQYINGTNIIRGTLSNATVRFVIPKGAKIYYLRITHIGGSIGAWCSIENIKVGANINTLNSGRVIEIPCSSHPFVQDFSKQDVSYKTDNFTLGGLLQFDAKEGLFIARGDDTAIAYKFKGTADQIRNAYIQFTGSDYSSPDGSWFNVLILDSNGNQVYSNNLTNLAGGGDKGRGEHAFMLKLKEIAGLAEQGEFTVKFSGSCQSAQNDVALKYLEVGYELVGDVNLDCKVDSKDIQLLAGDWLNAY